MGSCQVDLQGKAEVVTVDIDESLELADPYGVTRQCRRCWRFAAARLCNKSMNFQSQKQVTAMLVEGIAASA